MSDNQPDLEKLGWDQWFEARRSVEAAADLAVARVAAVDRERLLLLDEAGSFPAKLSGSYRYQVRQPEELPCVGDWVSVRKQPGDDFGTVHHLLRRRTFLRRKAAGGSTESQMIAANVDYVIVVQSCHFDFNLRRLERYLVMVMEGGAEPLLLLTKTDLVEPDLLARQVSEIRAAGITAPVLTLSSVTREGIDDLRLMLKPGKTYCFVGSSGVGKSTIINELLGSDLRKTSEVSVSGEGRHTTVRRELLVLRNGALVIDNPGMREFGVLGAEGGIEGGFSDLTSLSSRCRFRDCSHTSEPGCAVLRALENGEMVREHYENYTKLKEESEFHDMSRAEKRKKDRDFGKFIKSVKKSMERD